MGRIRTIKPDFPQSLSIGRLTREERLLFILLWTIVDDSGRARGDSRVLASLLYPFDDDAKTLMDEWLFGLRREGLIDLYEVDDTPYLEICKWLKHQKIDRPSASKYPPNSTNAREPSTSPRRGLDAGSGSGSGSGPTPKEKPPLGPPLSPNPIERFERPKPGKDPADDGASAEAETAASPKKKTSSLSEPTDAHRVFAESLGLDVADQWARYVDHAAATGKQHRDRSAGFRNWLRKAAEFGQRSPGGTAFRGERRTLADGRVIAEQPDGSFADVATGRYVDPFTAAGNPPLDLSDAP